jgi:hypothetical protein
MSPVPTVRQLIFGAADDSRLKTTVHSSSKLQMIFSAACAKNVWPICGQNFQHTTENEP